MEKIRILVVRDGNVGRGVLLALKKQPDMEACGIASRSVERVRAQVKNLPVVDANNPASWATLRPDAAILCGGSKDDLPVQGPTIAKFITTVDSFDNHSRIPEYFAAMDKAARASGQIAIISTGWAPGIFSLERVLANAFLGTRA